MFKIDVPITERVTIDGEEYPLSFCPTGATTSYENPWGKLQVYVIEAKLASYPRCKVGLAIDPHDRRSQLQVGSPVLLTLKETFSVPRCAAKWVEDRAHQILMPRHSHNEWFRAQSHMARNAVKDAMEWLPLYRNFYVGRLYLHPEWRKASKPYRWSDRSRCKALQNAEPETQDADLDALMVGSESQDSQKFSEIALK